MSWTLAQAGNTLYAVGTDGAITALTLPTNVTLDTTRKLRTAILGRQVIVVNGPTVNLAIDGDGTVRTLVPRAPAIPPTLAAGAGTGLTGTFSVRYSNAIKDRYGTIVAQSPLSPAASKVLANQSLAVSNLVPSTDSATNCRIVYRTTVGGTVYFQWYVLDDNVITSFDNSMADAALSLLATVSSDLGLPPGSAGGTRIRLIVNWKNRLWAVSDLPSDVDVLRYSNHLQPWAWPESQYFPIPRVGETTEGITALIPRDDDLAICKRASVRRITGDDEDTWAPSNVNEGHGLIAPDSVVVQENTGYGIGEDGVYAYDDSGFHCISEEKVHPWFTTDDYFNRAWLPYAQGGWNPKLKVVEFHLAAAGSSVLDRWIGYDPKLKRWSGPHKTAAFTPTARALVLDASGTPIPLVGGNDGYLYTMNNAARTDKTADAIDFDGRFVFPCDTPDIEKMFLQPDVLARVESGGTLSLTPTVGGLDATPQSAMSMDLTLGRQKLGYIGPGRILQMTLGQATNARDLIVFGVEIPYFELGRK